jgi:hypothetical protein
MEMSRQIDQAPNWILGQLIWRARKPSTFSPSLLQGYADLEIGKHLPVGSFSPLSHFSFCFRLPLFIPLGNFYTSSSLNVTSLEAFPELKDGSEALFCYQNIF